MKMVAKKILSSLVNLQLPYFLFLQYLQPFHVPKMSSTFLLVAEIPKKPLKRLSHQSSIARPYGLVPHSSPPSLNYIINAYAAAPAFSEISRRAQDIFVFNKVPCGVSVKGINSLADCYNSSGASFCII